MEIYASMTPFQRWEQAVKLRDMAWAMKKAGLHLQFPDLSGPELEERVRQIFLRATT